MATNDDTSRIRWGNDERRLLARRMIELSNTPQGAGLSNLKLLALAQEILPLDRRREGTSWAPLRNSFEPVLEEFRNSPFFGAPPVVSVEDEAAEEEESAGGLQVPTYTNGHTQSAADDAGVRETGSAFNGSGTPASLSAQAETPVERALLEALDSPRVRAALTQLFQSAMGQALLAGMPPAQGAGAPVSNPAAEVAPERTKVTIRPKVLIAGLDTMEAEQLTQAMGSEIDFRYWRPSETRDQLRQTAKPCSVAVLMPNTIEPGIEAIIKSLKLTLVRHTRGLDQLIPRLQEMREHGLLNLLT